MRTHIGSWIGISAKRDPRDGGFTLVELLVVLAVVAILSIVAIPASINVQRSVNVNRAGQLIQSSIKLARQTAATQNRYVEFRFYATPSKAGTGNVYNAFQIYIYDENAVNATALNKLTFLPDTIMLTNQFTGYSTILDSPTQTGNQVLGNLGGGSYIYKGFRFKDGGGTDLPPLNGNTPNVWYVTLSYQSDPPTSAVKPPKNYYTVEIDPISGESMPFRP